MADNLTDLTLEYVSNILAYDPDTGVLTWRRRPKEHFATTRTWSVWNTRFVGKEAGSVASQWRTFYRRVCIDGRRYLAHRIAYLLHYGAWPEGEIDHLDGDGLNNRASNLRNATVQENSRNQRMRLDNTSGANGVSWHKRDRKWRAVININGRQQFLGNFDTVEEATAARIVANGMIGFTERHGVSSLDDALVPFMG